MYTQLELNISANLECAKQFSCPVRSVCHLVGNRKIGTFTVILDSHNEYKNIQRAADTYLKKNKPEPCRYPLNVDRGRRIKRFWQKSTIHVTTHWREKHVLLSV